MIRIENLRKAYNNLEVLKGINLQIKEAEVVAVVGASGAGKTTLLNLIGSLDKPDAGEIHVNNININKIKDKELSSFRNKKIGFVFQFHHLLPEFNVYENISFPALIAGKKQTEIRLKIQELLDLLNIKNKEFSKPSELSGGEQQRALINNPAVILADEPSGNLDSANANELHKLFFTLRDKFNQTFIIVTHNESFANMADRKIIMKDGIVV